MINLTKRHRMFTQRMGDLRLMQEPEKLIAFTRKGLLFTFNFHPERSASGLLIPVSGDAEYTLELSSDDGIYGGQDRVAHMVYPTKKLNGQTYVELYLPARTAAVLKERPLRKPQKSNTKGRSKHGTGA